MKDVYFNTTFTQKRGNELSHYSPMHPLLKNCIFRFDSRDEKADQVASAEAHLADAIARIAEITGVGINEVMHLFPFVLRMLKSTSEWSK